jgi:hypothetical protein
MTFHDYLLKNLEHTAMIDLRTGDDIFQYNYWNWFHQKGEFHLLNDDYTLGHILHYGSVESTKDGSIVFSSKHHPCKLILNFYFGRASK